MTNQTNTAKDIAIAIIDGTETVLDMQGAAAASVFFNSEMVNIMSMVFDGEMDYDAGHKAYGILRTVMTSYTNEKVWYRNLRHAKEAAERL